MGKTCPTRDIHGEEGMQGEPADVCELAQALDKAGLKSCTGSRAIGEDGTVLTHPKIRLHKKTGIKPELTADYEPGTSWIWCRGEWSPSNRRWLYSSP